MSQLKRNVIANFVGNFWIGLVSLAFVPLYIHFLGVEAYGLMGLFISLQALLSILDLGISTTLNREIARLSALANAARDMRNLVRTLELIYWGVGAGLGVALVALAPFLAHHWLRGEYLSPDALQRAVVLMGIAVGFQWPSSFYSGGLQGLQRQVLLNLVTAGAATVRAGGAALILWLVSPTIQAFFGWQIMASALQTVAAGWSLWRCLPEPDYRPTFQHRWVSSVWRFAAGMSGISILALTLTQLDKLVLSKALTLQAFGYYTLASTAAYSLYRLIGPVFSAFFPRFSRIVSDGDQASLVELYHRGCQLMSVLVLPTALILALFSREILILWTGNAMLATETHLILTLLAVGTALNGLMNLPYALQLAYGWTRLAFITNLVAVAVLVPLLLWVTSVYGGVGAAAIWVVLNAGYVLITVQVMHRRLLRGEQRRWYVEDIGLPLAAAVVTAGLGRSLITTQSSRFSMLLGIAVVSLLTVAAAAIAAPSIRRHMLRAYSQTNAARV